jgi:hypothetical protein
MGWYFRKSKKFGPFRLTLSKRGLGASVGAKGLRVGTGPRGAYVSGSKAGFGFRQSFGRRNRATAGDPVERHGCAHVLGQVLKVAVILLGLIFVAVVFVVWRSNR